VIESNFVPARLTEAPTLFPRPWRVLALLTALVFVSFVDRGTLGIAAPLLKDDLQLSASELGILLSAYFWANTLCLLPVGWLIDRFEVTWILAIGFTLWSLATTATGVLHGFIALLLIRLLVGGAESVVYPSCSKILARHFPEQHRGLGNAFITASDNFGYAFATFAGGTLISKFGWRFFFVFLGLFGLPWLPLWLRWRPRENPGLAARHLVSTASIGQVLRQRAAWGTFLGMFGGNYMVYQLVTWLPFYLVHERHFSLHSTGTIGGAAFVLKAISAVFSGRVSDRWISSGGTPTLVRKTFLGVGLSLAGLLLVVSALANDQTCIALLLAASVSLGLASPQVAAVPQTLAGPQLAGTWASLQAFVGSFGGVIAPILTGLVVNRTGQFFWAFVVTALLGWIGMLSWLFLVGTIRPVVWIEADPSNDIDMSFSEEVVRCEEKC
jgi:MFS family permease